MATQVTTEPAAPPQHKEVENLTAEERAVWLKEGSDSLPLIEPEKKVSSSEADASAASKPASETGGKEPGSGPGKKERDAERNWRALTSERDELRAKQEAAEKELEEYRSGRKKLEEKKEPAGPKLLEQPKRPKMTEFRDTAGNVDIVKYEEALDKYEGEKRAYEDQQTQLRYAASEQTRLIDNWSRELKEKYGDKAANLDVKKTVDTLVKTQSDAPAFFFMLNTSEVFNDLLFVLGTDPKLGELLEEAKKEPAKAIRRLALLEEGVRQELAKGTGTKKADEKGGDEPPARQLTRATRPPAEPGGGASTSDDGSADAAFKRTDLTPEQRGELYRTRKNQEEAQRRKAARGRR